MTKLTRTTANYQTCEAVSIYSGSGEWPFGVYRNTTPLVKEVAYLSCNQSVNY